MRIVGVFVFLPLIYILACTSCESNGLTNLPDENDSIRPIDILESLDGMEPVSDPMEIKGAAISGDVLKLRVTYSGGCEKHDFVLYAWRGYNKSNPPQALLHLFHDAHGDNCEALITKVLYFSLVPLREQVFRNKGPAHLRIHGPGSTEPLMPMPLYDF